jgi:P4 family phage/plasmid primase-like protien
MTFTNYLNLFRAKQEEGPTHLSFVNGKFVVPFKSFENFYKHYYSTLGIEKRYLIEKINGKFKFFLDIEHKKQSLDDTYIQKIVDAFCESLGTKDYLVSKRKTESNDARYHVTFYNTIVGTQEALDIVSKHPEFDCVDSSVYKTGLRMIGSGKIKGQTGDDDVYRLYSLEDGKYLEYMSLIDFYNTSILYGIDNTACIVEKNIVSKAVLDNASLELFETIKKFNMTVLPADTKLVSVKELTPKITVLVSTFDTCPFVGRKHSRNSNPLYIIKNENGIFLKCHDSVCSGKRVKLYMTEYTESEYIEYLQESLSLTHFDVANLIFQMFKDVYRVDTTKAPAWYKFDGIRWKQNDDINIVISTEVYTEYRKYRESLEDEEDKKSVTKLMYKLKDNSFKSAVLQQVVYLFYNHDPKFYERLDANEMLLGFENGVYDFTTLSFREGIPNDYLTFTTGYDYIENTEHEQEILEMLSQILPDKDILHYTLVTLAKALRGLIDEKFYMWTGISGANGKSTLVTFLEYTLGDYITSIDTGLLTTKRGNPSNASPDVFRLKGKRIFNFQEPEHDDKIKTGILKQYTGGDTIVARDLFKSCITFKLQGTMIMCCNDLPIIESVDGGTWRRLRVTEFNSRFCENPIKDNEFKIDPDLKRKMRLWKVGFINILVQKYKEFLKDGLVEPKDVTKATNVYKNESDNFSDFLDLMYIEDVSGLTTVIDIYNKFSIWWIENFGNAKILDIKQLKKALKTRYGREKVRNAKNSGYAIRYIG